MAVGGIGSINESLQWLGISSFTGNVTEVYGEPLSTVAQSPWLSKSEKERIEDLLLSGSLAIPPPQINIAAFKDIALRLPEHFSLTALVGGATALGSIEGAALLAALAVWGQSQEFSETDLTAGQSTHLEGAVRSYVADSPVRAANALTLLAALRRQTQLLAAMKKLSPETIDKAVTTAEQQLIIAFLLNWSASEAKLAQQAKEDAVEHRLAENEYMRRVIAEYIRKAELTQTALKEPSFSILIGGLAVDAGTAAAVHSITPFNRIEKGLFSLPESLAIGLNAIAGGVITAATVWSAPTALSLVSYSSGLSRFQLNRDAAEAFAITLSTLVTNPEFDTIISLTLNQAVSQGQITEKQATGALAALKASLLLSAMASLYKGQYGGVTGTELRAIITGEMKVGETDFCGTLAKLITEQLLLLPPEDREKALNELLSPFDDEAPYDGVTQPLADFLAGWDPTYFRDTSLASPG